jgi:hypothetical protein
MARFEKWGRGGSSLTTALPHQTVQILLAVAEGTTPLLMTAVAVRASSYPNQGK